MSGPLVGVVNAGSSSLKFALYEAERRVLSGAVDGIGTRRPRVRATEADGAEVAPPLPEPPLAALLDPVDEVYEALVLGTRDYVGNNGFSDVVIGLSGGVDSSLVAAIAVDALGAGHVHGVAMPSRFSSEGSETDAALLADGLGIELRFDRGAEVRRRVDVLHERGRAERRVQREELVL